MAERDALVVVEDSNGGALAIYDPAKASKRIDVLAMAEKHYAKAKDAKKLLEAIRAKLEAQADFVHWWDNAAEKDKGGRPSRKPHPDLREVFKLGENGLPTQQLVSRWRAKLGTPERFEKTLAQAFARYQALLEFESIAHVGQNSGDNEWFTPPEYIEAARDVLDSIDLDPASNPHANTVVKATTFYTAEDDGLKKTWRGRVWMNPPYAQPLIARFCEKLSQHVTSGDVPEAVVLVNNGTETGWFQTLADVASAVCFPSGRVKFWHPEKEQAAPLQGQAILYFGIGIEQFVSAFSTFGVVWRKP